MNANISSNFQTNLSLPVEQLSPPAAIWHPPKNTLGQKDGWTLAVLTEVNDFPSHVSWEVNTRTQTSALWPCLDAWALLRSWDPYLSPPRPPSLLHQPSATLHSVPLPSLCIFCLCLGATVAAPDSLRSGVTGHGLLWINTLGLVRKERVDCARRQIGLD